MALTESQIIERNKTIREESAEIEQKLNDIHQKQMAELSDDYESKLKAAVDAANESFKKNTQKEEMQETIVVNQEVEIFPHGTFLSQVRSEILFSSMGFLVGILLSCIVLRLKNRTNSGEQKKTLVLHRKPLIYTIAAVLAVALAYSYFSRYSSADLEKAEDAAYQDGFDSGYEVGYDDGHEDGYLLGYDNGYEKGYDTLKPVNMPQNGSILSGKEYNQSKITVTASSNPCVVSLKDIYGTERVTFFVRPYCTATIGVPRETMNVFFATGEQWYGYGKGLMFGEKTVYSKDSKELDFRKYTWEYTLYPVTNGNFTQTPSTENEFF